MSIAQRLLLAVPDAAIGFTGPVFPSAALSTLEEPPTAVKPPKSRRKPPRPTEPEPPPPPPSGADATLQAIEPVEESGVVPVAEDGRERVAEGEEPLQVFERLPSGSLLVRSRKRSE